MCPCRYLSGRGGSKGFYRDKESSLVLSRHLELSLLNEEQKVFNGFVCVLRAEGGVFLSSLQQKCCRAVVFTAGVQLARADPDQAKQTLGFDLSEGYKPASKKESKFNIASWSAAELQNTKSALIFYSMFPCFCFYPCVFRFWFILHFHSPLLFLLFPYSV